MKIDKILALLAFGFISLALILVAISPPATGYEISIYRAYPPYFWLLIIASFACGTIIMVRQAFSEQKSRWWIAGFSALIFTTLIVLLLPIFRGYAVYGRADVMEHIGRIKDIILTGHFPGAGTLGENFYPPLHILGASIYYATGLTPEFIAHVIPPLFSILYMLFIYLLAREITQNHGQSLLITAFGSPLLFEHLSLKLSPNEQLFLLFPLIIFLYYKSRTAGARSTPYNFLFILMLLLVPFFHPGEQTAVLLVLLASLDVSLFIYKKVTEHLGKTPCGQFLKFRTGFVNPGLILIATWFIWASSLSRFYRELRNLAKWFTELEGEPMVYEYAELLAKAGLSAWKFIDLFMKMHGQYVLYCLAAVIITLIVWRKLFSHQHNIDSEQVVFSFTFVVFVILTFIAFLNPVTLAYFRALRYAILAAAVLNGLVLYTLFHRRKKTGQFIVMILVLASLSIGLFNVFPSPITREAGQQVTAMELKGLNWFLGHQNKQLIINDIQLYPTKMFAAVAGYTNFPPNASLGDWDTGYPPDHFGYDKNDTYGDSCPSDRYFIHSKLALVGYPSVFPEYEHLWRFSAEDFHRLEQDPSANLLYNNGEFWTYYIYGLAKEKRPTFS